MLTLMMSLATVLAVDRRRRELAAAPCAGRCAITLGIALPIGLMWQTVHERPTASESVTFGLEDYPTRFWSYVAIALLSLLLLAILLRWLFRSRRGGSCGWPSSACRSSRWCMRSIFIALGKTQSDDTHKHSSSRTALNGGRTSPCRTPKNCRIDIYRRHGQPGHVLADPHHPGVPQHRAGLRHGVLSRPSASSGTSASRPDTDVYGLRGLTSCRWLFDPIPMGGNFGGADGQTPADARLDVLRRLRTASTSGKTSITSRWAFPMTITSRARNTTP